MNGFQNISWNKKLWVLARIFFMAKQKGKRRKRIYILISMKMMTWGCFDGIHGLIEHITLIG